MGEIMRILNGLFIFSMMIGFLGCGEREALPRFNVSDADVMSGDGGLVRAKADDRLTPLPNVGGKAFFTADDLFALENIILLREDPDIPVGRVRKAVVIGESLFLHDDIQEMVLQFDVNGNFIRIVGRQGQGPGEYEYLWNIQRIWDEKLAVVDGTSLKILIFDENGQFLEETEKSNWELIPLGQMFWPTRERMFVSNLVGVTRNPYMFAVVDWSSERPQISYRFGPRHPDVDVQRRFNALSVSRDHVWAASPYDQSGKVLVYDLEGRSRGEIQVPLSFPGLQLPDGYPVGTSQIHAINHLDDEHVLVEAGANRLYVFAKNGTPLARIRFKGFKKVLGIHEGLLITEKNVPDPHLSNEELQKVFTKWGPDLDAMIAAGFRVDNLDDDRVYLKFSYLDQERLR
jgi:hypothetical protein